MALLTARPETIDIDLRQTALVVVDMQNAFAAKGGMFDLAGRDISGAAPAIAVVQALTAASRAAGVQVIFLQMTYQPDLGDAGGPNSPNYHKELGVIMMRQRPDLRGKLLVKNTWDWQIVDALTPQARDIVITKSRYSGFCNTDMERMLRARDIRNLLFTGIATNVCVESTARDAYFSEFWPILIEDAMNHAGPDFNRQSTLWNFEHVFGWVTNSDAVLSLLGSGGEAGITKAASAPQLSLAK
ncbi:MAG: isochorismatase family protein [Proteobacteria bacterium]|nr:isochorismatase family protein [Pseudomonadota bacterium]